MSFFPGETSVFLRSAMIPLLSTKTCNQPEVYHGSISSGMICAGYLEGGIDSCQVIQIFLNHQTQRLTVISEHLRNSQ